MIRTLQPLRRRMTLACMALPWLGGLRVQAEVLNISADQLVGRKLNPEGVDIDLPLQADSGASVPLTASIRASAGLSLQTLEVFTPGNPNTLALKLRILEPLSAYTFTTRLRLAGSQRVWVVATLSNDAQIGNSAPTTVSASACFDAS